MWDSKIESLTREEIETIQLNYLALLFERVRVFSPYYKSILAKENELEKKLTSSQRKDLKDFSILKYFPFTTKSDLRDNYPFGFIAVNRQRIRRFHASSGTRGKPTLVAYTEQDLFDWAELCARSLFAAGVRKEDIVQNSYGYGLFTGGLGVHYGIEKLGASVVPASGGRTQQQILLLKDLQASVITCTPSYALNIANTLDEMGLDIKHLSLRLGIFGAEPWTEPMRQLIEQKLNLKGFDIYGLSEIMGPGVSVECAEACSGLHIWDDYFLAEIICPKTFEQLDDGEEGELVITTLRKEALPLIRYRTGDLTSLTRTKCNCGRYMTRMDRIKARVDDMIIVRGVNVYPSEIENLLLQIDELSPNYRLLLKREKALDELAIQVELKAEISASWEKLSDNSAKLDELIKKISISVKENLGVTVSVDLLQTCSLPQSEGKAVRVVDLRTSAASEISQDTDISAQRGLAEKL